MLRRELLLLLERRRRDVAQRASLASLALRRRDVAQSYLLFFRREERRDVAQRAVHRAYRPSLSKNGTVMLLLKMCGKDETVREVDESVRK